MRDRIEVREGDGLEVMCQYAVDQNAGCFADPPYSADPQTSTAHTLFPHHHLNHHLLFRLLANWRGPWLLTEDNSRMVRRLAVSYRLSTKRVVMNTSENERKSELMIWRSRS
jgi:hypothetical protein